jgi:hypothetical protein
MNTCHPGSTPTDRSRGRHARSSIRGSRIAREFYIRDRPVTTVQKYGFWTLLEISKKVAHVERRQRLDPDRAAGGDRDGRLRNRLDVRGLHHVHEIELSERCPLVKHADSELLDVPVHLEEPLRIGLQGLDALLGQRR